MDDALFDFAVMFIIIVTVMAFITARRAAKAREQAASQASSQARASVSQRQQIVEDIKATRTGRIVDEVSIVNELEGTSSNYRQYCELIGHSMESGGVIAPYSRREVAYYDLRCYRVDSNGETLIAHEKSIEPFYFTDGSCATPVYVDIDSFGSNCVLVNSVDRMEGPSSDFSKALNNAVQSQGQAANRSWATSGYAQFGGYGFGPGQPPNNHFGRNMPNGFDTFFGNYMPNKMGGFGGPAYHRNDSSGTEALIGIGLGMLLSSLAEGAEAQAQRTASDPNGSFRGYHIVEDVVPLNSHVYCLGELYRSGDTYHMGKSLSASYPSSYFATKPEAELIEHLK